MSWDDVATELLGSWPSVVSSWGREAIAAYVGALQSRGLTCDAALVALRRADGAFPPSAGEVTKTAQRLGLRSEKSIRAELQR